LLNLSNGCFARLFFNDHFRPITHTRNILVLFFLRITSYVILFSSDVSTPKPSQIIQHNPLFAVLWRQNVWEQHFGVNEGAAIVGITPVGRATVVRLQMNRTRHITARRRWIELGLFP
jgi:hypothetical protein